MRTAQTLILVAALSAIALLASAVARPALSEEVSPTISPEITVEELTEHVRILASDDFEGRRSGTPGGEAAAAYVARQFEAIGLEPAGDDGTYLQWFRLPMRVPVRKECSFNALLGGRAAAVFEIGTDWSPFSFSSDGELKGLEVVFVGYGIRAPVAGYDDYAGVDVKGKAVVLLRRGPAGAAPKPGRAHQSFEQKAKVARDRGAVAVIQLDDRLHFPRQADRVPTRVPLRGKPPGLQYVFAKRHVAEALFGAAGLDLSELEHAIDETGKPASRPLDGVRIDLKLTMNSPRTANVVGRLPGSDPKLAEEVVVVGAHYDHLGTDGMGALDPQSEDRIWNGADDNASGTSGLIEVAERTAALEEHPPRTILFVAFAAEELGLLGSGHYVEHPVAPLSQTVAMLNLDMIGRSRDGFLLVGGTGTAKEFDRLLTEAAEGSGLKIRRRPDGGAPSDNLQFNQRGLPTLFFFTGTHTDYHRATDTWDTLTYPAAKKVADVAAGMLERISRLPKRPEYVKVEPPRRSGVLLGVHLDPEAEGPGVLVSSVMQSSAAAKAGMIDGDRILEFAGKKIGSAEDLSAAIRGRKPGDEVEVVVRRGEEEIKLSVTF